MDNLQKGIITLIKSAILQQELELPVDFDLEEAYEQIRRHSVIALCYDGAVRCGVDKNLPVMKKLFQGYIKSLQISEGQIRQVERICKAFEENGIDYMPVKGVNMKKLYPAPELRTMGDADILIRVEVQDKIARIMEQNGYQKGVEIDYVTVWNHPHLCLELHKMLVSETQKDLYSGIGDAWDAAQHSAGRKYTLPREYEYLYEVTHFTKHFRGSGIGLRHVVDLWVYQMRNFDMDQKYIERELKKMHIWEFYCNVQKLIRIWFDGEVMDEQSELISSYIFSSGNWGSARDHFLSQMVRREKQAQKKVNRFSYTIGMLFPSVSRLEKKYTILKKYPWMLPLVWIYRPFYKLIRKEERSSIARHRKNWKDITAKNLQDRRQALQYVGLDYHF
jgi:hypothetical protein